jgi:hypothetical protein
VLTIGRSRRLASSCVQTSWSGPDLDYRAAALADGTQWPQATGLTLALANFALVLRLGPSCLGALDRLQPRPVRRYDGEDLGLLEERRIRVRVEEVRAAVLALDDARTLPTLPDDLGNGTVAADGKMSSRRCAI